MSFFRLLLIGTIGSGLAGGVRAGDPAGVEFFESRVRPVLVEHCHACHSATKTKAGLRLDSRAGVLKGGDSGPAIVPGDPGKSRLIAAIKYADVELQMPPRAKLPERAIADIETWVKSGAAWPDDGKTTEAGPEKFDLAARKKAHWCWQPVNPPAVPKTDRDPIDVLIREKLSAAGLAPSPDADPGTLLRRLSFALTGLPPTAEDVEQFIKSPDRRAAVDRMLASPRFGERWARHWLDLVRYAETRGHEFDYTQPNAWQYRDYVIRALNADVPYDQFVREHVAGDLLPDPRHGPAGINESVLATGFWWLGEQVHSPVELRLDEADRVDNQIDVFGKTFLGITLACARCHDHKFDAISTADYYSFASVLASSCFRQTRFETEFAEREAANKLLGHRAASAAGRHAALGELLAKSIADAPVTVRGAPRRTPDTVVIVDYQNVKPAEWLPDGVGIVRVRPGNWLPGAPNATEHAAAADPAWFDHPLHKESQVEPGDLGKVTRAGRSIRTPSVVLPGKRIYFRARGKGFAYAAVQSYAMFEGPLHRQLTLKFDAGPDFRWLALDTARYAEHRAHVEFAALSPDFAVSQVVIADRMPPEPETVTIDAVTQRKIVAKWAAGESVDTIEAGVIDALVRRPGTDAASVVKPAFDDDRKHVTVRESHLAGAMWEGSAFTGRVAIRGNPKSPGDIAVRRLPEALAGTAEVSGPGGGRLVIARQLTDPANPLVARVIVNRVWHHLMGRGIVASVDNFGVLGEAPTHPELLDHLADRFVREGWSIKKLIRAIVLTETFAQSSAPRQDAVKTDPENKLLHRAHLRRLEGEAVRDALLQLSGRLDAKMYGPPVPTHLSPFMEGRGRPGSSGPADGAGRRSIYLEVRRNFLSPFFLAFDAPTPFSTVGRRTVSNVPAQTLILLNDPFVREQSKLWAARTPDVDRMYREAFGRLPDDAERAACRAFAEKHGPAELAHALVNAKEFVYVH